MDLICHVSFFWNSWNVNDKLCDSLWFVIISLFVFVRGMWNIYDLKWINPFLMPRTSESFYEEFNPFPKLLRWTQSLNWLVCCCQWTFARNTTRFAWENVNCWKLLDLILIFQHTQESGVHFCSNMILVYLSSTQMISLPHLETRSCCLKGWTPPEY